MSLQYLALRKKYPQFVFKSYSWKISKGNLNVSFYFKIEPDIRFHPRIVIKNIDKNQIKKVGERVLNNLVFQLGLIELLSYWKVTCSPEILIKAGPLNKEQIKWWKDLIIKGMGQFFYENKIDFQRPNFLKIESLQRTVLCKLYQKELRDQVLIPIGGGKDSIVTLEILKRNKRNINCFSLNPTRPSQKVMKIARCKNPIIVKRKIDEKLLELNRKGFLNGHTPFSAYLAFLNVFCAVLFDLKYIAFSNERSSNEGNLEYLSKVINHQYSKSFDFEKRFRGYSKKYLAENIEYFSFLRPLYEIQISKLFSKYPKYFSSFISCNEAFKTNSKRKRPIKNWCKKCSKCLFIWTSLYPFLGRYRLVEIFGENLFERISFLPTMLELTGEGKFKPFECVGTKKESLVAFYLSWKKETRKNSLIRTNKRIRKDVGRLPFLLEYFERNILPKHLNLEKESKKILNSWNNQHNLPGSFEKILSKELKKNDFR